MANKSTGAGPRASTEAGAGAEKPPPSSTRPVPGFRLGSTNRRIDHRWTSYSTHFHLDQLPAGAARGGRSGRIPAGMRHPDFPRASAYDPAWGICNSWARTRCGSPTALTQVLPLEPGIRVLDLGCGTAITSIFLAREHGVQVWAADLWIEPILEIGRASRKPACATACSRSKRKRTHCRSAHAFFDAIVSIDSYHYYGTDVRYLSYVAPSSSGPAASIGIVVPGNAVDPDDLPTSSGRARHRRRLLHLPQRASGGRATGDGRRASGDERGDARRWSRALAAAASRRRRVDGTPLAQTGDAALLLSEHGTTWASSASSPAAPTVTR